MALSEQRQGEIALAVLKYRVRQENTLPLKTSSIKRELGNVAKATGVSIAELRDMLVKIYEDETSRFLKELREWRPRNDEKVGG